jgi:hypothetical protein
VFPFYLFKEGNPQLADISGGLLVLINIKSIITSISKTRFNKFLFLFVIYTIVVNTVLMLIITDGELKVIKNSIFYLYCYFLMLFIFSRLNDKSFLLITYRALSISVIIQFVCWPFLQSQGVRTQMFFNNPNQLALWGVCILVIIYTLTRFIKLSFIQTILPLLLTSLFIIISASRAALLGCIAFWLFYIIKSRKHVIIFSIIAIVGFLFVNYSFEIDLNNIAAFEYNKERFATNTLSGRQSFGGRGYDRIVEYPQYLALGAGEGAYWRFNVDLELHSNLPNILFCYGIIGLLIYLSAFATFFKGMTKEVLAILFVLAFFGSVHMTMRIPLYWIALLFVVYLHEEKTRTNGLLSAD